MIKNKKKIAEATFLRAVSATDVYWMSVNYILGSLSRYSLITSSLGMMSVIVPLLYCS